MLVTRAYHIMCLNGIENKWGITSYYWSKEKSWALLLFDFGGLYCGETATFVSLACILMILFDHPLALESLSVCVVLKSEGEIFINQAGWISNKLQCGFDMNIPHV